MSCSGDAVSLKIDVRDRNGRIIAIAEINEKVDETYLGNIVRESIPQDIRAVLSEYHEACESGSIPYFERVLEKVQALELQAVGIPGKEMGARLRDFQLGPDGDFALKLV